MEPYGASRYVDYSEGVPDMVKQFVVYFYRHIRCVLFALGTQMYFPKERISDNVPRTLYCSMRHWSFHCGFKS